MLQEKQVRFAPFSSRIFLEPCAHSWKRKSPGGTGEQSMVTHRIRFAQKLFVAHGKMSTNENAREKFARISIFKSANTVDLHTPRYL
ncbi:MAG TPA: hypothetical protein VMS38_09190 [Pseudorhodoferax sp.]|nr:hypothetical protein [Pseudorhodoferax sp.]